MGCRRSHRSSSADPGGVHRGSPTVSRPFHQCSGRFAAGGRPVEEVIVDRGFSGYTPDSCAYSLRDRGRPSWKSRRPQSLTTGTLKKSATALQRMRHTRALRSRTSTSHGPSATCPGPGWRMRADLFAKCLRCGGMVSLDPDETATCSCGSISKDADAGRFGSSESGYRGHRGSSVLHERRRSRTWSSDRRHPVRLVIATRRSIREAAASDTRHMRMSPSQVSQPHIRVGPCEPDKESYQPSDTGSPPGGRHGCPARCGVAYRD